MFAQGSGAVSFGASEAKAHVANVLCIGHIHSIQEGTIFILTKKEYVEELIDERCKTLDHNPGARN